MWGRWVGVSSIMDYMLFAYTCFYHEHTLVGNRVFIPSRNPPMLLSIGRKRRGRKKYLFLNRVDN
jgi:hypothetical protein